MTDLPRSHLRLADLAARRPSPFEITPDTPARAAIADALGIVAIKKLRFAGQISPLGKSDWTLTAQLGATIVQECVVTLAPVTTRIDEDVTRTYAAELSQDAGPEIEMPDDDTVEPLPSSIDLIQVLIEALALALPAYPRADGAELGDAVFAAPGTTPMRDEDTRPFAGLGALRDSIAKKDESDAE